jgi:hypothetical protein
VQRNRAIRRLRRIALDAFWVSAPLFMIAMAFTFLSQPFAVECKAGACVRVCESVHIDLCPTHPQNQYRGPSHNTLSYQLLHHLRSCSPMSSMCSVCVCTGAWAEAGAVLVVSIFVCGISLSVVAVLTVLRAHHAEVEMWQLATEAGQQRG